MDNVQDKIQKGRAQSMSGESNPKHVLTSKQVEEIRTRYKAGGITQKELAARYGVARTTVSSITLNRNWKDVQPEPEPEYCGCCDGLVSDCGGAIQVDVDRFYCQNTRRGSW